MSTIMIIVPNNYTHFGHHHHSSYPSQPIYTAYLVIRRQLHSRDAVDMFLDFGEQIIPSSDDTTLVLIVDQVKLIAVPYITNLQQVK